MTVTEALNEHVFMIAENLGLPCAFAGESFIAPAGPYMRYSMGNLTSKAAGIGKYAPKRIDGSIELGIEALAGQGLEAVSCMAARVTAMFPYGSGIDCNGPEGSGEIIFAAPKTADPEVDNGRVRIRISVGFYAILFQEVRKNENS